MSDAGGADVPQRPTFEEVGDSAALNKVCKDVKCDVCGSDTISMKGVEGKLLVAWE